MANPLVSIVMPAYNCEKFIGRAIESIIAQTYDNWELIITEDGSKDGTYAAAKKYESERIRVYRTEKNTGTAYIPRYISFTRSKGEYILNIDADDYIEKDHISKCVKRIQETGADICCGKMVMVDENAEKLNIPSIPAPDFDLGQTLSGRDAFMLTVPRYRIAMNGYLAKRELWQKAEDSYAKPEDQRRGIHDDENLARLTLMYSDKVVFCDAVYYYTLNSDSVTHKINNRIFGWMKTNRELLAFVRDIYGTGREYRETQLADYYAYVHVTEQLADSLDNSDQPDKIVYYFKKMKRWHKQINWRAVKGYDGTVKWIIGKNFVSRWAIKLAHHKKLRFMKYVCKA